VSATNGSLFCATEMDASIIIVNIIIISTHLYHQLHQSCKLVKFCKHF